ncbi:MAG: hypothetical protein JXD18_07800 [Anaerolineae bacterium]|nr:hypothetical protein [Anaerolineae bacterium]
MSDKTFCVNHPTVETYLRCNRCGDPICPKCAVRTEVGYRCRNCINQQQRVFYTEFRPIYYLLATAVALPLSLIAGAIIPNVGWFAIFLGPLAGMGIAEVTRWAIGRRRGPYTWLVVCGCIVVGALPNLGLLLMSSVIFIGAFGASEHTTQLALGSATVLLWTAVYLVGAVGTAYARLRTSGRR